MSTDALKSDAEVAELFGYGDDLKTFHEHRRYYRWPCTKFGRKAVVFTAEQVAEIVAMQTRRPKVSPIKAPGQTRASASRRRAS